MKFVIPSTELLNHLQLMGKVMNSKNTLPILDNILLRLQEGKLTIMASDLETTLISELAVPSVQEEGSVAVPRMMAESLKEFPEQPLTVTVAPDTFQIEISWATGKLTLPGFDPQEFPKIPEIGEGATTVNFEASTLNDGILKTIFASAADELRPVMNGIYFDMTGECATFVASDAHKLVRYRRPDVKVDSNTSFILPKKPASLLRTILTKEQDAVEVTFDSKNAAFRLSGYQLVCRLIEGNFPAYNTVIPTDNPNKVSMDRVELLSVVKRIAPLGPAGTGLIRLKLSENQITILAQDLEFAQSGVERIACQYEGDELEIGFKSAFLIEILTNLHTQEVSLEFSDSSRAGLILPVGEDPEKEDTLMLLMPMMINA
ncbi:MAG: DNA polymerase III subunit beta [Prevotellaceae bacterium]|jgi:DNA polymerase-3 subunit beta|nr:DNA polymerase III subunit beta [Prevotellaceae bacterium]